MEILTPHNSLLSQVTTADFGTDTALQANVRTYLEEAHSLNTRKAYRSDLEHFRTWCGDVPASPQLVAQYIAHHGGTLSSATIARRLIAIGKAHTTLGFTNPCITELVRTTFRGVRRTHGMAQRQAKPLLIQDLLSILDKMSSDVKAVRDRALLLIGFAGAFRRSEIVGLDVGNIEHVSHGIIVTLKRSKTDQDGHGRKVGIPLARGRHCPVLSLQEWLAASDIAEGPIFRPVDRHGQISNQRLSSQAVSEVVKGRIGLLGHNPLNYSGHSLRAGLATSAAFAGLPSWKIRQQTGHASDAMVQRYIRDGELFRGNVLTSLL